MSEEEDGRPCFSGDEMVQFIGSKICQFLKIKSENWDTYIALEDSQKVIKDFFENDIKIVIFSILPNGNLTSSKQASTYFNNKGLYVLKKKAVDIRPENYRKNLLFGVLSIPLLEQFSQVVDQVCLPILRNEKNHSTWPSVVCQDLLWHVEKLQNNMSILRGLFAGRTLLPIPTVSTDTDICSQHVFNMHDSHNRSRVYTIESMVISWSHQIQKVLVEDSGTVLLSGSAPGPNAEFEFWTYRKENLQNIYEQIHNPVIQNMIKILEIIESSYYPTFKKMETDVFNALQEATDVELHLCPLHRLFSELQEGAFPVAHRFVRPIFHVLGLVWTHCTSYHSPARIVVLIQEFCNLLIHLATAYLSPADLLKVDTEEALEHVRVAVHLFQHFKDTFRSYRNKLASYRSCGPKLQPWDFPSTIVFQAFDCFLVRLLQLQDLFVNMLDLQKLENMEFGGIKGKTYCMQVSSICMEFKAQCKVFKDSEGNPLDCTNKEFEHHYSDFKKKVLDFECRFAAILCMAIDECSDLESAYKVLAICGRFLERPEIAKTVRPNLPPVLQMFGKELEQCKNLYVAQLCQGRGGTRTVNKNMPLMSGSLMWAKMLKGRVQTHWVYFSFIHDLAWGGTEMEEVFSRYTELMTLLHQYHEEVYSDWCRTLNQVCQFSLDQNLIKRETESGFLSVNVSPELIAVLKDVKYLQMLDCTKTNGVILALLENKDIFTTYVGSLELLVQGYNRIKGTVLKVELSLIAAELHDFDRHLHKAEAELTWRDHDCWDYICLLKDQVQNLAFRVLKAKGNTDAIHTVVKGWSEHPMFYRRDSRSDALLQLEDRADRVSKTYSSIQKNGRLIHSLIEENLSLFHANPSSDVWMAYVEYLDKIVVGGFFNAIMHSLAFFMENTDSESPLTPLLETHMLLSASGISYRPPLDRRTENNLYDLLDSLLRDIFMMSAQMDRVATHLHLENYESDMDKLLDLCDRRQEVMARVGEAVEKALEYQQTFDCYSHLWLSDRAEFMKHFLLYSNTLPREEAEGCEEDSFLEIPPPIKQFKEQIEIFENLYIDISEVEDFKVFDGWLKVDTKLLKLSLLNTVKQLSWTLKEHLVTHVIDSLNKLEEFITETDWGLRQPVTEGDYDSLVRVMGLLLGVKNRQLTTDKLFEPLKDIIALLEGYGQRLPDHVYTQMEELPEKWSSTQKLAVLVKHEVAPLQTAEVSLIRRKWGVFEVKQSEFMPIFVAEAPFNYNAVKPYSHLDKVHEKIGVLEEEMAVLQESSHLFDVSIPENRQLRLCRRQLTLLKALWDIVVCVHSCIEHWTKTHWREISTEDMIGELRRFTQEMQDLGNEVRGWDVYRGLACTINNFMSSLRAVTELQDRAMRERHWAQLVSATGVVFSMTEDTTLSHLLDLQLQRVEEEVHNTVDKAVKEMAIEKVLLEISRMWTRMEFSYEAHFQTSTPLLKFDEVLMETLEEHQVQLQMVLQSKHVAFFLSEVSLWQERLAHADAMLHLWLEVQCTWAHLHSIFIGSADISEQLPDHARRFQAVDTDFKTLMFESAKTKNFIATTSKPSLFDTLRELQKKLAECEKALTGYLETKRLLFPRFYFVSSADLLEFLSKGNQPKQVTRYLVKLFDNMVGLEFLQEQGPERTNLAKGMYSKEGEYVRFQNPCPCTGPVEVWLARLEDSMRQAVRHHVAEAVTAYEEKPREQWVTDHPAQAALLSSQIWWSADVGMSFNRLEEGFQTALKDYNKKQISQLNSLIRMLLGDLLPGDRQKIMTICTIDVHARDVVSKLIAQKVTSAQAFSWTCQLRHRWDDTLRHCFANICDAQFSYSYEYLGNTRRLVITPLTDRCYVTLTQSLHLTMSGAPAGPAGTGKTETTKDLGKALGVMVYVFNCSDQMDYKSLGSVYKGLAQTGAWGCFDEFNRISVEVLSVVAVQVKTIQDAIRKKKKRFLFLGEDIALNPSVGIFITMNPGYAGRTELPENLKALFRPCAMVMPHMELICEILLVTEGFQTARALSRKLISLYRLCQELLSKQDHYDWGLRTVKSVLVAAGTLKRKGNTRSEAQVVMHALRDFILPKIVADDVPIFLGLIRDLFSTLEVTCSRNPEFEKMIIGATLELGLQPEEAFVVKVVQLDELLAAHHSVFVLGNPGTGKSKILKTLNKTYANLRRKPVWADVNPKAVGTDELFGFIHPVTRDWRDGILSALMREQSNMTHLGPKWIILDGDIDPIWIESLNTVMDDNKVLTLSSNERIPLTPSMRLIFEICHLKAATPATVSRAGVLHVSPQDLGWGPYVASWIDTRTHQSERANLTILFDKYIPLCLQQLKTSFRTIIPISEISMVQTLCTLLDCLLTPENTPLDSPRELYEAYFSFAAIWAFGGSLHQDQLHDYEAEFSRWWSREMKTMKFPTQGTVFDYYFDSVTRRFLPWSEKVPKFEMVCDTPLQAILVHTSETVRLNYFMDLLLNKGQPLMLVGNTGVGKTMLVGDKMDGLSETYMVVKVPCNYYTTSAALQRVLEKPLEKKVGRTYGPPGKRKLIYFIDDMNMPSVDSYGTVQAHAFIRQHLDYGHWYERQNLSLKEVHGCQYISCMNPTSGNFTINPRLQRHFSVFAVNFPSPGSLESIYSQILGLHLRQEEFSPAIVVVGTSVVQAAIWLHHRMVQNFPPTAVKFHYSFNLRDLSSVFQGMRLSTKDCVKNTTDLLRLWFHESARVYSDRLKDLTDLQLFNKQLMEAAHRHYEGVEDHILLQQPLIYCHFGQGVGDGRYMPVEEWDALRNILEKALVRYNELNAAMNLVLFEDAMQHVCRISRTMRSPRGHSLLVGVGGSGKQSLARLAVYLSSLDEFQLTQRKDYSLEDLRVDLVSLYIKTGAKNIPSVLLFTDTHISDERFLIFINDLLISGEIPGLFSDEELDAILAGLRHEIRRLGQLDTRENLWRFFIDRVHQQLKVVLCFSPAGSALRVRARRFPALISCTTIDWFHEWPPDALESVSRRFLKEVDGIEPHIQESVSRFMAYAHTSVTLESERYWVNEKRYNYATPKGFLQQIALYRNLLRNKQVDLELQKERMANSLQKLQNAVSQVEDLKLKLNSQEAELNLKNQDAEALIRKIQEQTEAVNSKRGMADAEEQKVVAMKAEVLLKQRDCEADLAKAEPALEAASAALNTLNKVNLTELKTFPNPPLAVSNVMGAVMVLLAPWGRVPKDRSWRAARVFMGKVDDFLQALVTYDKEHIPEQCLRVVKDEYLSSPDFHPDLVRTKSFAAAGICAWVINIVRYYEVYCNVAPKRQALSQANTDLDVATAKLLTIRTRLVDLDSNLSGLTAQFERAWVEKAHCQEEVNHTSRTVDLAKRLVGGLEAESERWTQALEQREARRRTLCGDAVLAAAFVSYLGCFTLPYRHKLFQSDWIPFLRSLTDPVPLTDDLDPLLMLTDDATMAAWFNKGLPSDRMSLENAAILANCERCPLMIDPQQQGIKWVRSWYGLDLKVVQLGQEGFLDTIEQAMALGETVLIEDIREKIDPILEQILAQNTVKKGRFILVGGKECVYNSRFRLILHTKLENPHFGPELQAQTTLINFTVTRAVLEEQLLGQVVMRERPQLEMFKSELAKQQNQFKIELKELEEDLLTCISATKDSVLGDPTLVEKLEHTKQTAANIQNKVAEARENARKIGEARELYRPAAERASLLCFILISLKNINPMYQFSLKALSSVVLKAVEYAMPAEDVGERVRSLTEAVTYSVFLYANRALFERDKLTLLSQMAFQILLVSGSIDAQELDLLLRFPVEPSRVCPVNFLSPQAWGAVRTLSTMDAFRGLDRDVEGSAKFWKKLVESDCPERERFPQDWKSKSSLQKLILLRALRPDRMASALRDYVEETLGLQYVNTPRTTFETSFQDSGPATPLFFMLSPGVDPLKDVESLGWKLGFTADLGKLHNVSLGQGQEALAERALVTGARDGHWVILQNIHLVPRWLGTLEKLLEKTRDGSHPDSRVFITAEPSGTPEEHIIPPGILADAIKITDEPPAGMRANLHAALYSFSQDTLETCTGEREFNGLMFALCYFHACITGRRKFGPLGWNRSYPFSSGDLAVCVNVLRNYLDASTRVPWEDLHYLFGEIMYGGHITDQWDRRVCLTYLQEYMQPRMFEGELFLCPGFLAPSNLDYSDYHSFVDSSLPPENPILYGLHPNAEIELLTNTSTALFRTLLELQPRDSALRNEGEESDDEKVKCVLDDILEKIPEEFSMVEIMAKSSERSPYILVCFQECERMNVLIHEIIRSLKELDMGLKGQLTMSSNMEVLKLALLCNKVPESWTRLACPSTSTLAHWLSDLMFQCQQLDVWTQDLTLPAVVWLPGFFNPQSFFTAIIQSIAHKNKWPLDMVCLSVDVTKKNKDDFGHPPREGAYIHGLYLEGARWDTHNGTIANALPKELAAPMPVLYIRAAPCDQQDLSSTYECPLYRSRLRGSTYIWTFPLRTRDPSAKWVLAGVALLMSV